MGVGVFPVVSLRDFVAPPAHFLRASGSAGSRLPQRHLIKPLFMRSAERVEILKSDGEEAHEGVVG